MACNSRQNQGMQGRSALIVPLLSLTQHLQTPWVQEFWRKKPLTIVTSIALKSHSSRVDTSERAEVTRSSISTTTVQNRQTDSEERKVVFNGTSSYTNNYFTLHDPIACHHMCQSVSLLSFQWSVEDSRNLGDLENQAWFRVTFSSIIQRAGSLQSAAGDALTHHPHAYGIQIIPFVFIHCQMINKMGALVELTNVTDHAQVVIVIQVGKTPLISR